MKLDIKFKIRLGNESDLKDVSDLFTFHYFSDLTSKDPDSHPRLQRELRGVLDASTILIVSHIETTIIGACLSIVNRDFSQYEYGLTRNIGYLSKNVVHSNFRGLGIGKALVEARIIELRNRGIEVVYSSHHADNIPSARVLDAFNFEYVETFFDPEKRPCGSQMTTIRRLVFTQ